MRDATRTTLTLLIMLAGACGKGGDQPGGGVGGRRGGGGAVPVRVARATRIDAPISIAVSGVVDPMQTVAVTAQVSGALQSVAFTEGQFVSKGQVLFRIDPRPLEAALDQARAALARDRAQAVAAQRNDTRYQTLVREDYVTREQADQIHATALAQSALVAADEAAVRSAQLNLAYATIRAPIEGRTGRLLVRAGNIVGPATGPLVVINQLQPIQVRFPVLSQDLPILQGALAAHPLPVTATKSDSGNATERGQLTFLDNAIDSLTGTVTGKAILQNRAYRFWPGQLVFLTVDVGVQRNALAVPSTAVLTGQQGAYVYVVDPRKLTTASRNVATGRTVGDMTLVSGGLRDGEEVVTDGQSRLNPGSKVTILPPGGDTAQSTYLHAVAGKGANGDATGLSGGEVSPSTFGTGAGGGRQGATGGAASAGAAIPPAGGSRAAISSSVGNGGGVNATGGARAGTAGGTPAGTNGSAATGTAAGAATVPNGNAAGARAGSGTPVGGLGTPPATTGSVSTPATSTPARAAPTTSAPATSTGRPPGGARR